MSTGLLYTPGREMKVIWKRVKQPAIYLDMSAEMLRKRGMEIFRDIRKILYWGLSWVRVCRFASL